jgi:hypothetical protein
VANHNPYPELVYQKAHGVGVHEEHSFEDALRQLVRNSPYLGISLLLHGIVLVIMFSMKRDIALDDLNKAIVATPETLEEVIPPEPPPPEPEVEEIEEVIEEPVVAEEVVTDIVEVVDFENDLPFDNTGQNDVIGVGAGGGGNFGRRGKAGARGQRAGKPHFAAVEDALMWLKYHQVDIEGRDGGYWSAAEFDLECGKQGDDVVCDGLGHPRHDIGVTGLALLAFLGADNTDERGKHKAVVKAGLRFLLKAQDRNGNYADEANLEHTYDHIIATLAVIEAYALTNQHKYKKSAQKGLDYMYSLRKPGKAWRYGDPNDPQMVFHDQDVSVTGWAIMAMTMAKDYGMKIDQGALEDSYLYIDAMTDNNGRTGYYDAGGGSARENTDMETRWPITDTEAMTSVGVLSRIFMDPNLERVGNEKSIEAGVKLMLALPIDWDNAGRRDFYYWYYATYAIYQWGGKDWNKWQPGIDAIEANQIKEGEAKGSWDPQNDPWGHLGGRVYSTAILALLMEVYYRYDTVIGSH